MNLATFSDTTVLKSFDISIENYKINIEDVLSIDISWTKDFTIKGTLLITDLVDIGSLYRLHNNKISIYSNDIFDEFYFRDFIIVNIEEVKYENKMKALEIEFCDIFSYKLNNTYLSKSFKNKKLSNIINEYFTELKFNDIKNKTEITINETSVIRDFITVPQNISFLDFINLELEKEGYILYQTRKEIILENKEKLIPLVLPKMEFEYTQLHILANHAFKIYEVERKLNMSNIKYKLSEPVKITSSFDFNTKSIIKAKDNLSTIYNDIKSAKDDFSNIQDNIGIKFETSHFDNNIYQKNMIREHFSSNIYMSIVVPGNNKYNKIYQNADILLSGNVYHVTGINEGDVPASGLYTCYEVHDKIMNGKMIQKLIMKRLDSNKG